MRIIPQTRLMTKRIVDFLLFWTMMAFIILGSLSLGEAVSILYCGLGVMMASIMAFIDEKLRWLGVILLILSAILFWIYFFE
ncbi:MAG: hypothetical protein ACXADD_18415 [Candidatus Thorarchaeota archaeon]|jgi:hypothetical protein